MKYEIFSLELPRTIQTWDFFYCLFWSPAEYEEHEIKINN
jgi:hypothetical protein